MDQPGSSRPWSAGRHPQALRAGGCRFDEQMFGGEMGGKEERSGSHAVERDRVEEKKVVRNGQMWVACVPPGAMGTFRSEQLRRAMSGSVVLTQPGSVLTPVVQVAAKGHKDAQCLGCSLWPCRSLKAMISPGSWQSEWPALSPEVMVTFRSGCCPPHLGPCSYHSRRSVLKSRVHVATEVQDLGLNLWPC